MRPFRCKARATTRLAFVPGNHITVGGIAMPPVQYLLAWATFGAIVLSLIPTGVAAQSSYPNRPIRFVVPYPPGGGTDFIAREIGQRITEALGQPVVIDNR